MNTTKGLYASAMAALLLILTFHFSGCAFGPGSANGNMGSTTVLLQLKTPEGGGSIHSADGYSIELEHMELFFLAAALINEHFSQDHDQAFRALMEGNPSSELFDIAALPAVEYSQILLWLGAGTPEHFHEGEGHHEGEEHEGEEHADESKEHHDEEHEGEEHAEAEHDFETETLSLLIEGKASAPWGECHFVLELLAAGTEITVNMGDVNLEVPRDETSTMVILFDQENFFSSLELGESCHSDQEIHMEMNPSLMESFLQSFEMGEPVGGGDTGEDEGHGHDHG